MKSKRAYINERDAALALAEHYREALAQVHESLIHASEHTDAATEIAGVALYEGEEA